MKIIEEPKEISYLSARKITCLTSPSLTCMEFTAEGSNLFFLLRVDFIFNTKDGVLQNLCQKEYKLKYVQKYVT